jgi:hypothetical protein
MLQKAYFSRRPKKNVAKSRHLPTSHEKTVAKNPLFATSEKNRRQKATFADVPRKNRRHKSPFSTREKAYFSRRPKKNVAKS